MKIILFIQFLFLITTKAYKPYYDQINCSMYNTGCRQCVRYVSNFEDHQRGCSWCSQPNYFHSYCFNPNTTVCNGTVNDVCPADKYLISITSVLCLLPLIVIIILLIVPMIVKKIQRIQKQD